MAEHFRDDTYQHADDGRVLVACTCGWRSSPITPDREGPHLLTDETHARLDVLWSGHIAPLTEPDRDSVLLLGDDGGGPRYYLAGEPIRTGSPLELLLPGGTWWRGRLEVEHSTPDPWGRDRNPLPVFYGRVGGPAEANDAPEYVPQVHFPLPPNAVLRRPPA